MFVKSRVLAAARYSANLVRVAPILSANNDGSIGLYSLPSALIFPSGVKKASYNSLNAGFFAIESSNALTTVFNVLASNAGSLPLAVTLPLIKAFISPSSQRSDGAVLARLNIEGVKPLSANNKSLIT